MNASQQKLKKAGQHAQSMTELGDTYIPFQLKEPAAQQSPPQVQQRTLHNSQHPPMAGTQTGIPPWANGNQQQLQYEVQVNANARRLSTDSTIKPQSSQYNSAQKCAVFWDYENCPPPNGMPGYVVIDSLRQAIHHFGQIMQFKAYLEINDKSPSEKDKHTRTLRSELQSSGVSLTDVPHNGQKDAVDKMLMIDLMTFALDHPAPATIVLISGDKDFVYALSTLRNRRYTIVLVVPNSGAPIILKSQANAVLEWRYDVLNMDVWNSQQQQVLSASKDSLNRPKKMLNTSEPTSAASATSHGSTQQQPQTLSGTSINSASSNKRQAELSPATLKVKTEASSNLDYQGPIFSPVAPGFFDLLIEILERCRVAGESQIRRSRVGGELSRRNPLMYHRAGCQSFKEYVDLAVKENIVTIGGDKGNAWISLNEQHHGKLYASQGNNQ